MTSSYRMSKNGGAANEGNLKVVSPKTLTFGEIAYWKLIDSHACSHFQWWCCIPGVKYACFTRAFVSNTFQDIIPKDVPILNLCEMITWILHQSILSIVACIHRKVPFKPPTAKYCPTGDMNRHSFANVGGKRYRRWDLSWDICNKFRPGDNSLQNLCASLQAMTSMGPHIIRIL